MALEAQATPSKSGGGVDVDSHGNKAGKGPLVQHELSSTLGVSQDQTLFAIQGNVVDRDAKQHGSGVFKNISPTLNTVDRHAISQTFGIDQQGGKGGANYTVDIAPTMASDSHGTPHAIAQVNILNPSDSHCENVGVDIYNQEITDNVAATLTAACGGTNTSGPKVMSTIGVDTYNQTTTGEISKTLNSTATDADHVPCVMVLNDQGGEIMSVSYDVTATLRAQSNHHEPVILGFKPFQGAGSRSLGCANNQAPTLDTSANAGVLQSVEPIMVQMTSTNNAISNDGISPTLIARMGTGGNQVNAICMDVGFFDSYEEKCSTLLARQYKDPPVVYGKSDMANYNDNIAPIRASGGDCGMGSENLCVQKTYQDVTGPLMASGYDKLGTQEAANDMYVAKAEPRSVVRRLTPLECERLQGFPDGWTDIGEWVDSKGKKHKDADSPRYKALGNSIAVGYANGQSGFWCWLARRICAQYERSVTMGSLFDGIGGFPLAFEAAGAKAVWASEIEEFPIAVTKYHFGEE